MNPGASPSGASTSHVPTRLLLIEDNPGDAIIFREKLNESSLDYELVHTMRLDEGLELLSSQSFDLILCDLSLPDADGMEAVVAVRRVARTSPVIVLTGLDDADAAAKAREEGAIDYLVKWYQDGPTMARYIRYAIEQEQTDRARKTGAATPRRRRPPRATAEEPSGGKRESAEVDQKADGESAGGSPPEAHPLEVALDASDDGIVVVTGDRHIVYANRKAREWIGDQSRYPWPHGRDRRSVISDGVELDQQGFTTKWEGRPAFLVRLRAITWEEHSPSSPQSDLLETTQATLNFIEQQTRNWRWLSEALSATIDLEQQARDGIQPSASPLDVVERLQFAVKDLRDQAMERGVPIRTRSSRDKVLAFVDRNLFDMLLRRLVTEALTMATTSGVDIEAAVEGPVTCLTVHWRLDSRSERTGVRWAESISQHIVESLVSRLRGRISIRHEEGGQTVLVRLPGREDAEV